LCTASFSHPFMDTDLAFAPKPVRLEIARKLVGGIVAGAIPEGSQQQDENDGRGRAPCEHGKANEREPRHDAFSEVLR
jgi:hypothetical protein